MHLAAQITIKEKCWTKNIYEIVFYSNTYIRYKLSIFNYPNSLVRLVKYNRRTVDYKVLYEDNINETSLKVVKYIMSKIIQKEYNNEREKSR